MYTLRWHETTGNTTVDVQFATNTTLRTLINDAYLALGAKEVVDSDDSLMTWLWSEHTGDTGEVMVSDDTSLRSFLAKMPARSGGSIIHGRAWTQQDEASE